MSVPSLVGWMVAPLKKDMSKTKHLILVNVVIFGQRVLVDVLKWRISRWNHPGLSRRTLNPMTNVFIRGRRGGAGRREERSMCKWRQRLELHGHKPRNAWSQQNLEEARKDCPWRLQMSPLLTPWFGLWLWDLLENNFYHFKPLSL